MNYLGWIGNVLIVYGLWTLGSKWRHAFLFSAAGEVAWIVKSVYFGQWDLAAVCVVFCVLAVRNWFAWRTPCA